MMALGQIAMSLRHVTSLRASWERPIPARAHVKATIFPNGSGSDRRIAEDGRAAHPRERRVARGLPQHAQTLRTSHLARHSPPDFNPAVCKSTDRPPSLPSFTHCYTLL